MFDGSKLMHWTEPFEGTRYSIVFFHTKIKQKIRARVRPTPALPSRKKKRKNNNNVEICEAHNGNLSGWEWEQVPETKWRGWIRRQKGEEIDLAHTDNESDGENEEYLPTDQEDEEDEEEYNAIDETDEEY